ncbi:MAG: HNH endonuclease signature motif containing protein [Phycisphaerales bacterium]
MTDTHTISRSLTEQMRAVPTHAALVELCEAARDARLLAHPEFKKLVAYLLEVADNRDRREPWTTRPTDAAKPVPKLRLQMEACFGVYADLHWFKLNKTSNRSGQPLRGLFPRMAASLARVECEHFADFVRAMISPTPDAALAKLLQESGGKMSGLGVEVFSRLAYAFRRDLYFAIPRAWGDRSGCLDYIGGDLRKYCGLCRNLRGVCDELGFPEDVRGSLLLELLSQDMLPKKLAETLHRAIGPSIARFSTLKNDEAYMPARDADDADTLPADFAADSIRARRGRRELRQALLKASGDRCAFTGSCLRDLLETSYFVPFPEGGDVHGTENAMLLRSDVHTLWDLNMLGVEPGTLLVRIAGKLRGTVYGQLAGRELLSRVDGSHVNALAIEERWAVFTGAHPDWEQYVPEATEAAATEVAPAKEAPTVETGRGIRRPAGARGRRGTTSRS